MATAQWGPTRRVRIARGLLSGFVADRRIGRSVMGELRRASGAPRAGNSGLICRWQAREGYRPQFRTDGGSDVPGRVQVLPEAWRAELWRGRLGRCRGRVSRLFEAIS